MAHAELKSIRDIGDFLTDRMMELPDRIDRDEEEAAFRKTFATLAATVGPNAFRRYDVKKQKFLGGFLLSTYEVVALGIGYHSLRRDYRASEIEDTVKKMWSDPIFVKNSGPGVRASLRLPNLVPLGRRLFAAEVPIGTAA
jgi:hypothetical protein